MSDGTCGWTEPHDKHTVPNYNGDFDCAGVPNPSAEHADAMLLALKNAARSVGDVTYNVTSSPHPTVTLRCCWRPDMSYGRLQEPLTAEFQWQWEVWTPEQRDQAPAHMRPDVRGWVGIAHEGWALRLLQGETWVDLKAEMLAMGRELAGRY